MKVESNQVYDGPHHGAAEEQNEQVSSNRLQSKSPSGPFWEGPGVCNLCPSNTQWEEVGLLIGILTDQTLRSVASVEAAIGQASPRDEPQRKADAQATPAILHPPTLEKNGTAVTGALKHHLKRQNKQQKTANQLNQE